MKSRLLIGVLPVLAFACGGGGGGTTNPPPTGDGYAITASSATSSVARGGTSTVTVTVTRSGSFTGPVSLQPTGMPTGVTALFSLASVPPGQNTSTLTFAASATAALGPATITVVGNGSGVTPQYLTIQLTVTAAAVQSGPFTLSISATSYLVYPNEVLPRAPIVTVTRNPGFTGPVALSVSGLPPTLFVGFTPNNVSGSTATAHVVSAGVTPNGTYTAQIRGASAQGDQTITLQIVVAPPSTGSIKWRWCSSTLLPYFLAVRDGNGPWTRLMPANDSSFSFTISSGKGELAEVRLDSGGFRTTVYQLTAPEMAARAASQCSLYRALSTRTASGSFGGVTGFNVAQVGMGWWFGSTNGNGNFTMLNLPPGPVDVMAVRNAGFTDPSAMPVDRMIIRRGQNPASGSTMPVLDFGAAESFAPATAQWTFLNANGQAFGVSQMFRTTGGSIAHFNAIPSVDGTSQTRTIYGVPQAQTLAGDLHQVIATVATVGPVPGGPVRATRQIVHYARTLGVPDTLAFGSVLPAAAVSAVAPGRLRAQGTLPAEYNSGVSFDITQTTTARFFTIYASRGFLGAGSNYDLQMPDLSAAIGWDTQFAIQSGVPTNWWVSGGGPTLDFFDGRYIFNSTRSLWTGILTGITLPADGATYLMARTVGVATP